MFSLFVIELSFGHFNKYWKTHVVRDKIPSNLYDTWMFKQQGATRWNLDWHSTGEQVRLSDCLSSFSISLKKLHLIFGFFGLKSSSSQFVPLSPSPKYDHSRCTSLETLQGWRLPSTMQQHPLTPHTISAEWCAHVPDSASLGWPVPLSADNGGEWLCQPVISLKAGLCQARGSIRWLSQCPLLSLIVLVASLLSKVWRRLWCLSEFHHTDLTYGRPASQTEVITEHEGEAERTYERRCTWKSREAAKYKDFFFFFESKFQMFLWTSRSFSGSFLLFPLNLSTNICTSYFPHWKSMCAVYLISVLKIQIMFASSETKCSVLWCSLTGKWTLIQVSQDWLHSSVYF